jgi:hypothetical protein
MFNKHCLYLVSVLFKVLMNVWTNDIKNEWTSQQINLVNCCDDIVHTWMNEWGKLVRMLFEAQMTGWMNVWMTLL